MQILRVPLTAAAAACVICAVMNLTQAPPERTEREETQSEAPVNGQPEDGDSEARHDGADVPRTRPDMPC